MLFNTVQDSQEMQGTKVYQGWMDHQDSRDTQESQVEFSPETLHVGTKENLDWMDSLAERGQTETWDYQVSEGLRCTLQVIFIM